MKQINIKANVQGSTVALPHMWSKCVGAGRAAEGLRADWQAQLRMAVENCGFEYIRFHGLLTDDMGIVHKLANGRIVYNFSYVDSLFDALLDIGIRPFVELGFTPNVLASGTETVFWWKGNKTPPAKMEDWADFITAIVEHWKERYGLEEISKWYFEVWNEPNLSGFWTGTKSEYFELYKTTVNAVKSVDAGLKVGGPATSNFVPDDRFDTEREDVSKHITHLVEDIDSLTWKAVWMEDFIAYCTKEDLPVDFISTHPYPTDFALDGHHQGRNRTRNKNSLKCDLLWLENVVRNSKYKDAEIHLTEWSSSPTSRDFTHDHLPAADYIVKSNIDCAGLSNSLSYWVFTDIFEEGGPGPTAFHGGFGMITVAGIKKPSFHAFRMLNQLGKMELTRGEEFIVTKDNDDVAVIVYNYADDLKEAPPIGTYPDPTVSQETQAMGEDALVKFEIEGLLPNQSFNLEILDKEHGTAVNTWIAMGSPDTLTRAQQTELTEIGNTMVCNTFVADTNGVLKVEITLPSWGVALLKTK